MAGDGASVQDRLANSPDIIDEAVLSDLEGQMGREIVESLVDDFAASSSELLSEILRARGVNDREGWIRAAHSLKSSAANMGLAQAFKAARTIEECGERGDFVTAAEASDKLQALIDEALGALRSRYAGTDQAAK